MSKQPLDWTDLAARDPYLAGSIAARGWEPWEETTAEGEAERVGLTGDARDTFLAGWNDEIAEQEADRDPKRALFQDYEAMGKDYSKGDPAR